MSSQGLNAALTPPLDLSHHYARITKARAISKIKQFYKYFAIPGIGQLAGGITT
jgi:site-specific recombinase XerD